MSATQLSTFIFGDFELEVTGSENDPWFIATPLAAYLGYQNPARDIRTNVDDEDIRPMYIPSKSNNYICVNESGLYSLVLRSNKPEAKRFKKWVASEVLPAIRKTGSYALPSSPVDTSSTLAVGNAADVFHHVLRIADSIGLEGNQRLLSADQATLALTGISPLKLLGVPALPAPIQERLLTPTEIGSALGVSARKANKILELNNLQFAVRDHKDRIDWELTNEGKAFGVYQDTTKKQGSGAPIRQIRWHQSVLKRINAALV